VLTEADEEALRWYLEDYLDGPQDPVTASLASRAQARQRELGGQLFDAVFGAEDTRAIWSALRPRLHEARVEVVTDVAGAVAVPWELMRDPATDTPLALAARSFVRAHPQAARTPWLPERADTVRALLVISRPGRVDIPFRSVAARLAAMAAPDGPLRLDVLRPPTFAALQRTLSRARNRGMPYHVVRVLCPGAPAVCDRVRCRRVAPPKAGHQAGGSPRCGRAGRTAKLGALDSTREAEKPR
jgi:hypothetical protein